MPPSWPPIVYERWQPTCDTLHAHTQLLGKLAVALAPPEPQLQHAALRLGARGWETLPLPAHEPGIAVPLRIDADGTELSFFSTISTFGTAVDITLAELSIEAFFPADERTGDYVRSATMPSSSARAGASSASNRTA